MNDPLNEYRRRIYQKVNLQLNVKMRVLEIGCGDGFDSLFFSRKAKEVTGIDKLNSHRWPELCQKQANLKLMTADAEKMPFANNSFDLVFAKDMLHHTASPERVMKEILRVTVPGGKIMIIEANRYNPLFYFHLTLLLNHQHFNKRRFRELIKVAGGSEKIEFLEFEAHVLPLPEFLRTLACHLEDFLEKIIVWRPFLSYNAAVITKED